jgi:PAS domain-containing protein
MPDRAESPEERNQLRASRGALTARREFVEALAIMRATLESTTDAILVTDEKGKVIDFNERYIGMWKIPREALRAERYARCGNS